MVSVTEIASRPHEWPPFIIKFCTCAILACLLVSIRVNPYERRARLERLMNLLQSHVSYLYTISYVFAINNVFPAFHTFSLNFRRPPTSLLSLFLIRGTTRGHVGHGWQRANFASKASPIYAILSGIIGSRGCNSIPS